MTSAIKPFAFLGRFTRSLLYGFRRQLRPYEDAIISAVLAATTEQDRRALEEQLAARERVQRWNSDRMLLIGLYHREQLPKVKCNDPDYCYAKVHAESLGRSLTAKVITHYGVLHSVEFSKSPTTLIGHQLTVTSCSLLPGGSGFAETIDAEEHGFTA